MPVQSEQWEVSLEVMVCGSGEMFPYKLDKRAMVADHWRTLELTSGKMSFKCHPQGDFQTTPGIM